MYKLIIADDEQAIRRGMCRYINWAQMGFEVVADFEDGAEVIDYLREHPADAVLTDIRMADVTGLDVARFVWERRLPVRVVIISGYRDFDYARQAVEYSVEHYLLKPLQMDEVQKVFSRIREELDRGGCRAQGDRQSQEFEEQLPELREQFWISLLAGGIRSRENILRKGELLRLGLMPSGGCLVFDVQMTWQEDEDYYQQQESRCELLRSIFRGESEEICCDAVLLSSENAKVIVWDCAGRYLEVFAALAQRQMAEKCDTVRRLMRMELRVKEERRVGSVLDLADQESILRLRPGTGREAALDREDYTRLLQEYKLLMEVIQTGDLEQLDNLTDTLFTQLEDLPEEQVGQMVVDLFSMLSQRLVQMGSELWIAMNQMVDYQELLRLRRPALRNRVRELLQELLHLVRTRESETSRQLIEKACAYMRAHYGEDLFLEGMADRCFLNPSYFSRLFKQHTGRTFTDYLLELRMEEAKRLLQEGTYRIYEVSRRVGYRGEKYFYRVFRQYTGCSPAEYQRNQTRRE